MFAVGVDFGTNSGRALIVRCADGAEFGAHVVDYPSGAQGVLLDPKDGLSARQHPGDYLFGLEEGINGALAEARRKARFDASKMGVRFCSRTRGGKLWKSRQRRKPERP
jgi:L-ribulokinase